MSKKVLLMSEAKVENLRARSQSKSRQRSSIGKQQFQGAFKEAMSKISPKSKSQIKNAGIRDTKEHDHLARNTIIW